MIILDFYYIYLVLGLSKSVSETASASALADSAHVPVLSDSADWLKEYLDGAKKMVDEKYRANPRSEVEHTLSEKRLLQAVNHPFIVFLHGFYKDATNLYLVMDYVYGGELFLLIRRKGRLPEAWAQFYSSQVLLALQYLHYCNIVYRDLKPENIMIDHRGYTRFILIGAPVSLDTLILPPPPLPPIRSAAAGRLWFCKTCRSRYHVDVVRYAPVPGP
ncbi:CAMP-dependent protein kinase catalytic subunit [Plakobranchus ocellatus]|uniref:cAMP-dependent protein kinase catalytic subunit n=1 Tax=Plakobranchus ocellatus TaxID=259542 RepID=A0AAV4D745_9GAST|nr:CAMP-dependent protein kinase catalytic subunit [Plakobranchus ocellatus]